MGRDGEVLPSRDQVIEAIAEAYTTSNDLELAANCAAYWVVVAEEERQQATAKAEPAQCAHRFSPIYHDSECVQGCGLTYGQFIGCGACKHGEACDRLKPVAEPASPSNHSCSNCEGIDPASCFNAPAPAPLVVGEPREDSWEGPGGTTISVGETWIGLDREGRSMSAIVDPDDRARLISALGGCVGKPELTDEIVERARDARRSAAYREPGNPTGAMRAALEASGAFAASPSTEETA